MVYSPGIIANVHLCPPRFQVLILIWQKIHLGIACGPRVPLYLFFKKDAAAPANAALTVNKLTGSRPWLHRSAHYRPRNKTQPHPVSLVARTLRCWSTRPPVLRQALVFPT